MRPETEKKMWNSEEPASNYVDVPSWVSHHQSPTVSDLMAICQGGCDSGAWMPAVTYYQGNHTMACFGDEVLDFLDDYPDEPPALERGQSWHGFACKVLSAAVELWAWMARDSIAERLEEEEGEE